MLDNAFPKIPFALHHDERGTLTIGENQDLPFAIERVFWITQVPSTAKRGAHAHRSCHELFVALVGTVRITLHNGEQSTCVELNSPHEALWIKAGVWCELEHFSADFVGLCLASEPYSPDAYIHDFEAFLAEYSPQKSPKK